MYRPTQHVPLFYELITQFLNQSACHCHANQRFITYSPRNGLLNALIACGIILLTWIKTWRFVITLHSKLSLSLGNRNLFCKRYKPKLPTWPITRFHIFHFILLICCGLHTLSSTYYCCCWFSSSPLTGGN